MELQHFLQSLRQKGFPFKKGERFFTIPGLKCRATTLGVGVDLFQKKYSYLFETQDFSQIQNTILLGAAGSLGNHTDIGTVGRVEELVDSHGGSLWTGIGKRKVLNLPGFKVCQVEVPITKGVDATALRESSGADVVTMESLVFQSLSKEFGVPVMELRAVTDHCDEVDKVFAQNLPLAMNAMTNTALEQLLLT